MGTTPTTPTTPTRPPVLNVPNLLTAARLGLAVVLFGCIAWAWWWTGLGVFAAAAVTDWLDGYLARKQGVAGPFGRNFDPLVDKVLICGAFIFLLPVGGAGLAAWMVTVVVARELIITGLRGFLEAHATNFGADWLGKVKMTLQCAALLVILFVLARADGGEVARPWALARDGVNYAMLAATALSGLQYLWRAALLLREP
jgi:CDP-diacylglycerol--glycerol-3-phosphate 3-phosphatidyltransferase